MVESVAPPSALKQFLTRHKLFIAGYLSGIATALVVYLLARENILFAAGFFIGFLFCLLALQTLYGCLSHRRFLLPAHNSYLFFHQQIGDTTFCPCWYAHVPKTQ